MIDALTRRFLGTSGGVVLDFYIQYSLWINALLLLYACLILIARHNYGQVTKHILADFIQHYDTKLERKSPKEIRALLLKWKIPWENGMQASWFPFVTTPKGLVLYLKNDRTFKKILPVDVLVAAVLQQTSKRSS